MIGWSVGLAQKAWKVGQKLYCTHHNLIPTSNSPFQLYFVYQKNPFGPLYICFQAQILEVQQNWNDLECLWDCRIRLLKISQELFEISSSQESGQTDRWTNRQTNKQTDRQSDHITSHHFCNDGNKFRILLFPGSSSFLIFLCILVFLASEKHASQEILGK